MAGREVVEQLTAGIDALVDLCSGLDEERWDTPIACPGWTVKDAIAHVIGTESSLGGRSAPPLPDERAAHVRNDIGAGNEAWVVARRTTPGSDVLAELREVGAERATQLRAMSDEQLDADAWTPEGPGTYADFMGVRVFDCWVHEQDIRQALGLPWRFDTPAAELSVDKMVRTLGYVAGKKAKAPEGSTIVLSVTGPIERQTAVTVVEGRARPSEPGATPTATLRTDTQTYLQLAFGRMEADVALVADHLQLEGDKALAGAVAANLGVVI